MTNAAYNFGNVPEWDMTDRLRKSLREAGMTSGQMADYLGIARETISTWLNDKHKPSASHIKLWALRTGVPYEWIATGCTPRDLNPEPTD
jgi:transcriptional regulator with XRE-family HTH domain